MDGRLAVAAVVIALGIGSAPAYAINHTTEYRTNMGNYRTCTDPLLETCGFDEALSPSKFYLPNNTTTTVIHKDDGTVQLRIDAGGILTDAGISYACGDRTFECSAPTGGVCVGGVKNGNGCSRNACFGGTNDAAPCTVASQCPGGGCTAGASCTSHVCLDGPRNNLSCEGAGDLACTNVANTAGWSVVFRGNFGSGTYTGGAWHTQVYGDGESGFMKVCTFSLNGSGAINSTGLSCTPDAPEVFHYVELRDPNGEIVAIPTVGPAYLPFDTWTVEGDVARVGDCSRPSNAAFCP